MHSSSRTYAAVFLASLAALSFEILLLRVFSILFWHHFASMIVSISMLGLAASGTCLAVLQSVRGRTIPLRPWYFILLGFAMATSYLAASRIPFDPVKLSWDRTQLILLSCYYLVLSAPFFASGLIIASAFSTRSLRVGLIYSLDLCGAAAGTILVLFVQASLEPGQAILVSASLAVAGAVLTGGKRVRILAASLAALFLLVASLKTPAVNPGISPYKELPVLLRMGGAGTLETLYTPFGRSDLFRSPGIRYAPGISLKYRGTLPDQIGLSLDGGSVTSVTIPAPGEELTFLDYLPASLAYLLRPGGEVFLVDPRGGIPLLLARRSGAKETGCSESNPAVERILEKYFGSAFEGCRGRGLARNVLGKGEASYDIIDLSLTGTLPSIPMGAGEDYQLTVEAFRIYLESLKEDGVLNISLYINPPYRSELRIFTTVLAALEDLGAENPGSHVAALRSLETLSLLVRRTPFTKSDIGKVRDLSRELWFDVLWYDGMKPGEAGIYIRTEGEDLAAALASLADGAGRRKFIEHYLFDISPATDDRPYFHDTLKLSTLPEVNELVDGKWDFFVGEGYLIPAAFFQVAVLGIMIILLPAAASRGRPGRGWGVQLAYFGFIGLGYMLVEIGLIQRLLLVLEHPLYSFTFVVAALLLSSGLGSYASRNLPGRYLGRTALAAAALGALTFSLLGSFASFVTALPAPLRGLSVLLFLLPAGFVMGMPFPGGIRHLAGSRRGLIPWAWAVNGFLSVLAPLLASMLARRAGFDRVFLLAVLAYLGAALAGAGFCASPTIGTKRTPPI